MSILTDLIANTCLIEIAAAGLKRAHASWPASVKPELAGSFYQFFRNIEHSLKCEKGAACTFHATPTFLTAARAALERVCVPTLIALQEEVGADGRCLILWNDVASAMGITKEAVRQRYRLDRKCCNLTCPARNSGTQASKRSICVQCESVFYCDHACQKR